MFRNKIHAIKNIEEHSNDFLTPEALQTYSPKFLHMLENIDDPEKFLEL